MTIAYSPLNLAESVLTSGACQWAAVSNIYLYMALGALSIGFHNSKELYKRALCCIHIVSRTKRQPSHLHRYGEDIIVQPLDIFRGVVQQVQIKVMHRDAEDTK